MGVFESLKAKIAEGQRKASGDTMVFGDALERIRDAAGADIANSLKYLQLFFRQLYEDPDSPRLLRILDITSSSLEDAMYNVGRHRGNPMHRMGSPRATSHQMAERIVSRFLVEGAASH